MNTSIDFTIHPFTRDFAFACVKSKRLFLNSALGIFFYLLMPSLHAQCDVEVSGVMAYCNSFVGNNTLPGFFIGFRVQSNNGDTLNVIDLNGNVPMNKGKRINDINNQFEPSDTSRAKVRIAGGIDSLEFWYFGPFADGDTFNIVLVDPQGICDTIFVAEGTFTCQGQDPNACSQDVPLYFLDFSASEWNIGGGGSSNEEFDEVFLIMQRSRVSTCCHTGNDRCFEFIITLDEDDIGLLIDDVGNGSTGGFIYADSLNGFMCGTSQANTWPYIQDNGQSADDPLCLGDSREWIVLSCKEGNNVTGVSFGTVGRINLLPEHTYADCTVGLDVLNVNAVTWSSPDDPNLDNLINFTNNNTSVTFSYDEGVFGPVTSCAGDTFTYVVAGYPDNECLSAGTLMYDTSYVVVYPPFDLALDTTCVGSNDSVMINAVLTTPAPDCGYVFLWSSGDTTTSITVPNISGQYSVTVTRPDLDPLVRDCTPEQENINIEPGSISCLESEQQDCIGEPPPADISAVGIGGCGITPMTTTFDINNNGSGCGLDSLIISRYYVVDFDGDTINTTSDKDTCIQRFVYVDDRGPALACPSNVTLPCGSATDPVNTGGFATAVDNCDANPVISYSDIQNAGTCPQEYTITRTWKATDLCGNFTTCNQLITISDDIAPQIACPPNISIQCNASTAPAQTGFATASDNCDPTPTITYTDSPPQGTCPRVINRTWRATDDCGNSRTCVQTISLIDNVAPTATCPPDVTISCTASTAPSSTGFATGSDNCDLTLTVSHTNSTTTGSCPQNKTITRTWTIVDDCNNSATCVQTITVVDIVPPVISCPANITMNCISNTNPVATGSATGVDNCDATVQITYLDSLIAGSCPNELSILRRWTATDDCGNFSTCVQTILINDEIPPVISCPPNITIECTISTLPLQTGSATANDNCDGALDPVYTDVISNGSCPQSYSITRTWSVTDGCGNASSCTQLITVEDTTAPLIVCPPDITIQYNEVTLPVNTGQATASDNCDLSPAISYVDSLPSGCVEQNIIRRTWTAIDDCGNSNSCIQLILIDDHGSICGTVSSTDNGPIAGVTIHLFSDVNSNGSIDAGDTLYGSVITDSGTGGFCFNDLPPCAYVLQEIQPANSQDSLDYDLSPDPDGDDSADGPDNEIPVILSPAEADSNNIFLDILCTTLFPVVQPDTICENGSVTFEIQPVQPGVIGYSWDFGSGATPQSGIGLGPHTVSYISTPANQANGAIVSLTIMREGCPEVTAQVSAVEINLYPDPSINAATTNLCYYTNRAFKPAENEIAGATYLWNFGSNAVPSTAQGYGPHNVYYTAIGTKTVSLVIQPNDPGAQCPDSSTISFNVINCPGNITGTVKSNTGIGIQGVNLRLYMDADTNGIADNNTFVRSVFTTANGSYSMVGLTPANYVVIQTQPFQWYTLDDEDTTDDGDIVENIDSLDNLIPVTLTASEIDGNNNFIETASPGSISGVVFIDMDNDELPDIGEEMPGVTINLYSDNDKDGLPDNAIAISTAVSSDEGSFMFNVVPIGNYVIQQMAQTGYASVKDYDATNDQDSVLNSNLTDDIIPLSVTNGELDEHNYFIDEHECSLTVANANDDGPGSLRYMIDCAESGDTILISPALAGDTILITSQTIEIEKNITIISTLSPIVTIASEIPGLFDIGVDRMLEISGFHIVSGISGHAAAAFYNFGILHLDDMTIVRNPLLPSGEILIRNSGAGQLIISGNTSLINN